MKLGDEHEENLVFRKPVLSACLFHNGRMVTGRQQWLLNPLTVTLLGREEGEVVQATAGGSAVPTAVLYYCTTVQCTAVMLLRE